MHPRISATSSRLLVFIATVLAGLTFDVAQASADSAAISVTTTAGQSDPAAGVPRVFTISGNSATPASVFVKYRNVGGAPCAATYRADTGQSSKFFPSDNGFSSDNYNADGNFSVSKAGTWDGAGPVQFCIWIAKTSSTISTPITQVVTFRAPTATINTTVDPGAPAPGQLANATFSGATEAPSNLYATVKSGGGCAPTFGSDTGERLLDGSSVNGAFSASAAVTQETVGVYTVCSWLASSSSDTAPLAGPQGFVFTVATPPPPPAAPSPPSCTLIDRSAKRGRAVRIRCYRLSGDVRVRYKRRGRTVTKTVALTGGVARAGTRGLAYGSWKVSVLSGSSKVGSGRVTVRRR